MQAIAKTERSCIIRILATASILRLSLNSWTRQSRGRITSEVIDQLAEEAFHNTERESLTPKQRSRRLCRTLRKDRISQSRNIRAIRKQTSQKGPVQHSPTYQSRLNYR